MNILNLFRTKIIICCAFILGGVFVFCPVCARAQNPDHYQIYASVDDSERMLTARQRVSFTNRQDRPINEAIFHIYPNRDYTPQEKSLLLRYAGYFKVDPFPQGFQSNHFSVHNVQAADGTELVFSIEGKDRTLLRVMLSRPLDPGQKMDLEMDFSFKFARSYGRLGWNDGIMKAAYWYPILAVQTAEGWDRSLFYPFHRPFFSEASTYRVELKVDQGQTVIHSGTFRSETTDAGKKTMVLEASLPVRSFSFAMSPEYKQITGRHHETVIRVFYLDGDLKRAEDALRHVQSAMEFYERTFRARYPYDEFSVAPVHLGYGGEQMPNMIFIDTRAFKLPGLLDKYFEWLIVHETGHQWIYNIVGVQEQREMWLEEGLNSFLTLRYIEERYGRDTGIVKFPKWFKDYEWIFPSPSFRRLRDYRYKSGVYAGYDGPLAGSLDGFSEPSLIFALVYGKGVRAFETLESQVGAEAFDRVLARVVEEHRFGNWTIESLKRMCEEESGKDLTAFFQDWVFSAEGFDPGVYAVRGSRAVLKNSGKIQDAVEMTVEYRDGTDEKRVWQSRARETVDFGKPLERIAIDPEQKFFDRDRVNNQWPRAIRVKPVPLYFGLWDNPLFLPEDSYNVVVGPEIYEGIGLKASVQKPYKAVAYTGSDYDFGNELWTSRAGYQLKNVFASPTDAGAEVRNVKDASGGPEDLFSTKIYMRRNLWPVEYGMMDVQDHVSLYFIHNQRPGDFDEGLAGAEDIRNIEYKRRRESIIGVSHHVNRSGPYPDPKGGFRVNSFAEQAGHFAHGGSYFYRGGADVHYYAPVVGDTKLALRAKAGLGYPDDKDLFQLGGIDGLRGYGRKTVRGANAVLGVAEYRVPLVRNIDWYVFDRIFGLRQIDGAAFAEAGQAWFSSFTDSELKKDVGLGIRVHVDLLGFLEKAVVRVDVAEAVNDSEEDPHVWFGINSVF